MATAQKRGTQGALDRGTEHRGKEPQASPKFRQRDRSHGMVTSGRGEKEKTSGRFGV